MENIKISCGKGAEDISSYEKDTIKDMSQEYYGKINRNLKNIISFDVYAKCYKKEENVKRFQINVKVISPNHVFESSSDKFGLLEAIKDAMQKIINEIEHKTHSSEKPVSVRKLQNIRERK